jgi:hypothetical protein
MNEEEFGFETEAIRTQLERTQYLELGSIILNVKFCI